MTGRRIAILIAAVALPAGAYKYVEVRRELSAQRQAIRTAWSGVEDAMQKRAELLPTLVDLVRRYAKHEPGSIGEVLDARAGFAAARAPQDKIGTNAALDAAVARLLDEVGQTHGLPRLKKNREWRNLMDELATAKNRIAQERQQYNEAVKQYNTNIQLFPNNVVAWLGGFTRDDAYFKTEPGAPRRSR